MHCLRATLVWCTVLLAALGGLGCSTVASTLGFNPPTHKLTQTAKDLRAAQTEPAPLPRELAKAVLPTHVIEPGDTIAVEATELDVPVLPVGDQRVLPEGIVDLGRYGRLLVAGKTVPQVEAEVKALVQARTKEKEKDAVAVSVRLIGHESKVYYVLGEVAAPGSFPIIGRETVLDGILSAGGITRQASMKSIIVTRPTPPDGCRVVLPVCYEDIVQLGDTATNYQLMPGDRIYVPSRSFTEDLHKRKSCPPCNKFHLPCVIGGPRCEPADPLIGPRP
jgi:protein involved in polysaccharide export with SLBB domain